MLNTATASGWSDEYARRLTVATRRCTLAVLSHTRSFRWVSPSVHTGGGRRAPDQQSEHGVGRVTKSNSRCSNVMQNQVCIGKHVRQRFVFPTNNIFANIF